MLFWKRAPTPDPAPAAGPIAPPSMAPETGARLAREIAEAIGGIGCLTGHLAQAAQEAQRALLGGSLDEERAAGAADLFHTVLEDVERACRLVGRARVSVSGETKDEPHA